MISDKAIISEKANIASNVEVGPFSVIGPDVEIGEGTKIGPHAVIKGPTRIGKHNHIFQFASIGEDPQDKKYAGEKTTLEVGDHNVFRECTTITRGTAQGGGKTVIGSHNLFMAYVHIAHDCIVGNHTIFSNNASLAGHVKVADRANLGGFVGVHQFCNLGAYCFCAGGSIIVKDVPPFVTVQGYPATVCGLNLVGLKRSQQFDSDTVSLLKKAYKILYRQGLTTADAIDKLKSLTGKGLDEILTLVDFVATSTRGIVR